MKNKRVNLVEIIKIEGNSFGDQIIRLKVDGEDVVHTNPEGEHVEVASWVKRYYRPIAVEFSGASALSRVFG